MKKYFLMLLLPLLLIINPVRAEINIPDRPENGIYDVSHHLSQSTLDKVKEFNDLHGSEFDIYITDTLYEDSISDVTSMTANYWQVGSKSYTGRGFLLVIATEDKKIKLKSSVSASYYLDESQEVRIVQNSISSLKSGDYDNAVISIINDVDVTIKKADQDRKIEREEHESSKVYDNDDKYAWTLQDTIIFVTLIAKILGQMTLRYWPGTLTIVLIVWLSIKANKIRFKKIKEKQENTDSAITETKEKVFSDYEESKESSHFDSPFE